MSAWTPDWFDVGVNLEYKGKQRTVKDWYFTSDGTHNGDIIIINFTDGTSCEGWKEIHSYIGSTFDSFLEEQGIKEDVEKEVFKQ